MISHEHKCIFIHIAKCAGTSVEHAFGVDTENHKAEENNFLFGWDKKNKLWLQHATPQQLLNLGLISSEHWRTYYKFVIFRNSWDRAYSDYNWMRDVRNINDSFHNYITRSGKFFKVLNNKTNNSYAGDHLSLQKSYFFLDGERINYDREINFESLAEGFEKVIQDLSLDKFFFGLKLNSTKSKKKEHYSLFYGKKKKKMVERVFKEDIEFFAFQFEEKKNIYQRLFKELPSKFNIF